MKDITFFPFFHRDDPRLSSASLMGALLGVSRELLLPPMRRRARPVPKKAHPSKRAARKRKLKSKRANR
jgi:hypothetical protein